MTQTATRQTSHKARVGKARAAKDALVDRIYACAPNNQTPFSGCLALAPRDLVLKFEAAERTLIEAEMAAVSAGKAYRASGGFGLLLWNR